MDILHPAAVIGTNSWGSAAYGVMLRGSYVDDDTIRAAMRTAEECDLKIYDLARDYGFGKAQKMIGDFGTKDVFVSAKYTPFSGYTAGCVRKSLEKDLHDFHREYVDIYWLHLPTDIEMHMKEIIALAKQGKIRHIGVSNFDLAECRQAKQLLEAAGMKLYGVQNHYSILSREWENNGLVDWCKENDISFWAWAVLEEGMLVDPRIKTKGTIMKLIFDGKKRKLIGLYRCMIKIAEERGITVPQVAIAFCASKGVVPMCGCRRPMQVKELAQAANIALTEKEIKQLESEADKSNTQILGANMFRAFVKKSK